MTAFLITLSVVPSGGFPLFLAALPGSGSFNSHAALGLLLITMALIASRSRSRLSQWLVAGALTIGAMSAGEYIARWDSRLDKTLVTAILFLALTWWAARWCERRRKTEEAERDRFFTLSLDLLCVAGTDGYFRRLNPAFQRILGYKEADLLGRPFIDFVHADDREATLAIVSRLARGEETVGFENRYRCKDGSMRWMLWTAAATPDGTVYAAARDITGRRKAEEELHRMVEELARSNTELEQFASVVSHDLQEPLRTVAGCVQILQQRYKGQLDPRADELIGYVVDGATRMKALIGDLITYSRVGLRGSESEPVDLKTCLKNALLNLRAAIEEKPARITYNELPIVQGNSTLLTQLFQNLIGNALKFCRDRLPEISITAARRENAWHVSVADNGIGIDAQYFERIFGVFQRLHTRREFEGTGIGLALCKKIVERHGGRIWVESEIGRGSVFHFTIPDADNQ
ncbi:MAG: multi-sensor signal transduction histidine kinase [Chthoniobacteraceae bacterium]|nr:multi-sensor signal transduction histidine kinase [Chthoniobacteraceae bacterium]